MSEWAVPVSHVMVAMTLVIVTRQQLKVLFVARIGRHLLRRLQSESEAKKCLKMIKGA